MKGGNVAVRPFLSVLVLIVYCSVVFTHFEIKLIQRRDVVETWRSMIELLVLALETSLDPSLSKLAPQHSISHNSTLKENVRLVQKGGQAGIIFVNPPNKRSKYQRVSQDDGTGS